MEGLIDAHAPDIIVIACNTASTLALPHLRARWPRAHFVGTVPAIKTAAQISQTRAISVLATPGTVARDYTQKLIEDFASDCAVTLVGSRRLAALAERVMHGERVADEDIAQEIAPCFVESSGARTDAVVLACTHYPLLRERFIRLAPWPVVWIDPAPAIARRADHLLGERFAFDARQGEPPRRYALFTSGAAPMGKLAAALAGYGLATAEAPV
jgi:glutamate racemase